MNFLSNNFLFYQSFELKNLMKELLKLTHVSGRLLSIINMSLMKIYPRFTHSKSITIDDLLQLDLWSKILTAYGIYLSCLYP